MRHGLLAAVLLDVLTCGGLSADTVKLKNGDQMTGRVKRFERGQMIFQTAYQAETAIDLDQIRTFSTTEPVTIDLEDGTRLTGSAAEGREGYFFLVLPDASGPPEVRAPEPAAAKPVIPLSGEKPAPHTADWTDLEKLGARAGSREIALKSLHASFGRVRAPYGWSGHVGLDIGGTSNTESTFALGGSLDASYLQRTNSLSLHADGKYGTTTRETGTTPVTTTTVDHYRFLALYTRRLPKKLAVRGWGVYEHDAIARLEAREILAAGFGGTILEKPNLAIAGSVGPAYVWESYTNDSPSTGGLTLAVSEGLEYWFSDRVSLKQTLAYYPAFDGLSDFFLSADLALDTDLGRRFHVELYGRLEHNSRPARSARKTTTSYRVSLKYKL